MQDEQLALLPSLYSLTIKHKIFTDDKKCNISALNLSGFVNKLLLLEKKSFLVFLSCNQ